MRTILGGLFNFVLQAGQTHGDTLHANVGASCEVDRV